MRMAFQGTTAYFHGILPPKPLGMPCCHAQKNPLIDVVHMFVPLKIFFNWLWMTHVLSLLVKIGAWEDAPLLKITHFSW